MSPGYVFCFYYVGTQLYLGIIKKNDLEEAGGGGYVWQGRAIDILYPKFVFINTMVDQKGSVAGHQVTFMPLNPLQLRQREVQAKVDMLHSICDVHKESNEHFTCSEDTPAQVLQIFSQYWNTVIGWENNISGNPVIVPNEAESKQFGQ
jgi:hypothetical protein